MATENAKFKSLRDCPEFIRKLVGERLGMRLDDINTWIDSDEPHAHKLIEDSILYLGELCKDEQARRAKGGAS